TDIPLDVTVDRARLEQAVEGLAEDARIEPQEGKVWFSLGEARATESVEGRELDVTTTSDVIEAAWPQNHRVTGVATPTEPELSQTEIDRFVQDAAAPAVGGPSRCDAGRATPRRTP